VVEVSGRTYPVEVRYRGEPEPADDEEADPDATARGACRRPVEAIGDAVDELLDEGPTATCSSSSPASARSATRPTT
jgi:HrpA-like RNA helicase